MDQESPKTNPQVGHTEMDSTSSVKKPVGPKSIKRLVFLSAAAVVLVLGVAGYALIKNNGNKKPASEKAQSSANDQLGYDKKASGMLTHDNCSGVGEKKIGAPMKLDQIGFIQPYGLMVGGHVTPVDHQYYTGLKFDAPRDTYDVVAPQDGYVVDVSHRGSRVNTPLHATNIPSSDEYRIVMAHTCSFLTYVDLVTSLDESIKSQLPASWSPSNNQPLKTKIAVKKGQVIGRIGGQTLDFAVWDLSKPLKGFANRVAYDVAEPWKLYTAPTSKYLEDDVKDAVLAKYVRSAEPIDGKIDYDQDGKLVGSWFISGTNGYAGTVGEHKNDYYVGHLSFAPDYIDPSTFVISTGTYPDPASSTSGEPGNPSQFWVKGNAPDPATVTPQSGLIKYELVDNKPYQKSDGSEWRMMDFANNLKAKSGAMVKGVVLVQMTEKGKIKVEFFAHKTAAQVGGFTSAAKTYDRGDGAHVGGPTSTAT